MLHIQYSIITKQFKFNSFTYPARMRSDHPLKAHVRLYFFVKRPTGPDSVHLPVHLQQVHHLSQHLCEPFKVIVL